MKMRHGKCGETGEADSRFQSACQFAVWLGRTPRAHSSGGKYRQTGISKQGDGYIRQLLMPGSIAVLRFARQSDASKAWMMRLTKRKKPKAVAVAQANKVEPFVAMVTIAVEPELPRA